MGMRYDIATDSFVSDEPTQLSQGGDSERHHVPELEGWEHHHKHGVITSYQHKTEHGTYHVQPTGHKVGGDMWKEAHSVTFHSKYGKKPIHDLGTAINPRKAVAMAHRHHEGLDRYINP